MPTVKQLAAKLNKSATENLIRNVRVMPDDKASWMPLDAGRSELDQLQECAIITGFTIYTLTNHALPPDFNEAFEREKPEIDTLDKAVARMEERCAKLCETIENLPDADLDITVKLPWMEEPSSLAELMFMTYWNTVYHLGQVNYIQTLYGDKDMH